MMRRMNPPTISPIVPDENNISTVELRPRPNKIAPIPDVMNRKPMRSNLIVGSFSVGIKYLDEKMSSAVAKGILKRNRKGQIKNSITIIQTVGSIVQSNIDALPSVTKY